MSLSTLDTVRRRWEHSNDVERVTLLQNGLAFAVYSVRQQVNVHERDYAAWLDAGRPPRSVSRSLPSLRNRGLRDVMRLGLDDVRALQQLGPWEQVAYVVRRVHGLGAPKAAFGLAAAGLGRVACLDIWLLRHYAAEWQSSGWDRRRSGDLGAPFQQYRALVERVSGGVADSAEWQWRTWCDLMGYDYANIHSVLVAGNRQSARLVAA